MRTNLEVLLHLIDPKPEVKKPRPRRTKAEAAQTRAFDSVKHIQDMRPSVWVPTELNIRPRDQRGIAGIVRRVKAVA